MVEAINQALRLALQTNPRVILMGQDIGRNGGVFRVTEGLWQEFGPDRVLDTPLAESAIVGTALGMAAFGLRPIAEIQFEGFSYLCFDQIVTQVARLRNRSRGRYGAPVIIRIPHGGGVHAPEHHSEAPEALFAHMPGLQVVIPSTPYDAKGLLLAALEQDDPVIFFEPKRLYRAFRQEIPAGWYTVPIGKARVVRPGSDVTLVSWGAALHTALAASREAERRASISAEVIDLRSLKPWDEETVLRSVRRTGRLVVVQEAWRTGGFGSEIISRVAQEALYYLESPPVLVAGWDIPVPLARLEEEQLPSVERIVAALERAVSG
ncbi:MAG: alpha-ketoacid dehydrogenase subunit beta [Limnochordales bacterium]|nr:alpha-ketoacid dehydrogenase subunit beta [Limnochordales bacterium]